ncbi:MAG: tripartite tricarboxylate transporter substrate binding protein [Burkholderiales bacterium]|nr:tripartite tricarboxylate transporter substrate binding protein [Burkholderiales bacterium]
MRIANGWRPIAMACGAGCLLAGAPTAGAQPAWKPEKPVEIIVTCQPGCGPDIAARLIQRIWQEQRIVGTPSVVVNKPGGGGAVAYGYLNQRPGDGHALVLSGAGAVVNTIMGRGTGHRDLTPLAMMAAEYVGVAVRADSAFRSGRHLIDALKKDPQAAAFGVANSLGNANHQAVALAMKVEGIAPARAKTVVFQSGANAIAALLGGHVQVVPASVGLWAGPHKTGQVRLVAVTSPKRMGGEFAEVPTWREQGVDAVVSVWRMITAPPGLTPAQSAFWRDALRRTTETPEWKRDLEKNHQADEFMAGPEFERAVETLHAQLKGLLTELELAKRP